MRDMKILKGEKWLMFLTLTDERNINLERINSLEEMKSNYVLSYTEKTLKALSGFEINEYERYILEEVLKWSEVAKAGLRHQRVAWMKKGCNLFAHNIGSAQIYLEQLSECNLEVKDIVYTLILTHGLIKDHKIEADRLKEILKVLNYCIVTAVDEAIWKDISGEAYDVINHIASGMFGEQYEDKERIEILRVISIANGEDFDADYDSHVKFSI